MKLDSFDEYFFRSGVVKIVVYPYNPLGEKFYRKAPLWKLFFFILKKGRMKLGLAKRLGCQTAEVVFSDFDVSKENVLAELRNIR